MTDRTDWQASDMTGRIRVTKAQLWEEAKGKLRAMVLVEGQCFPHDPLHQHHRDRYPAAEKLINAFIQSFEDMGYHE